MANFKFTQLATPGDFGYNFFRNPSINNSGNVVFEAFREDLAPPSGVARSDGSTPTPTILFDAFQNGFGVAYNPSISDAGTTSFVANAIDIDFSTLPPTIGPLISSGVYKIDNSGFQPSAVSGVNNNFVFLNSTDINSSGTTAFSAGFSVANAEGGVSDNRGGVYTANNGEIRTIADVDTTFDGIFSSFRPGVDTVINNSPFSEFNYPSINEEGTVAFTGFLEDGNSGIFKVGNDDILTNIANSTGELSLFSSGQINNEGQVAFTAELDTGERAVFLGDGEEPLKTIADGSGQFGTFFSDPSVNDLGEVAFLASLDGAPVDTPYPSVGIYVGSDPVADKVIAVGDILAGQEVTYVNVHEEGLNNNGQIAFEALLADGTYTVFRAEPQAVPEPGESIVSVLALGIVFALSLRWRQKRSLKRVSGI